MAYAAPASNAAATREAERRGRVERRLGYDSRELWAWDNYRASALAFVDHCRDAGRRESGLVRVLEIGGGRKPLLAPQEARDARVGSIERPL